MSDTKIIGGEPGSGNAGVAGTKLLVEPQFQAARMVPKPLDYVFNGKILGHYRIAAPTGLVTGVAAAGAIFSVRWADPNNYLVLMRLQVGAVITTAFTGAQAVDVDAVVVRGFTASDTGGTGLAPIGTAAAPVSNAMRKIMGASLITDARIAATAALGAGTGTADAAAFAINAISQTNAVGSGGSSPSDLYNLQDNGQHPLILSANEGLRVRLVTAQGAAGVVKYYVAMEWAEVVAF